MSSPFYLFDWNIPFLPSLKTFLSLRQDTARGVIPLLITPTSRPWKYLLDLYRKEGVSRILPRFLTLNDAVSLWHTCLHGKSLPQANLLDKIALLREAALQTAKSNTGMADTALGKITYNSLANLELPLFFPWGVRLANLIDEMLSNSILPEDIPCDSDEVMPYASSLLNVLGNIRGQYLDGLAKARLTTPGLALYDVAENIRSCINGNDWEIPEGLRPTEKNPVVIAGFHTLTKAQDTILKALWQAGACVCLHTDPRVAFPLAKGASLGNEHWICRRHRDWALAWGTTILLEKEASSLSLRHNNSTSKPISFLSGYDLHSQLAELQKDLSHRESGSAAIILPTSSLLMPVLHHLPQKDREDVNITMGCPLSEAPIYQLLKNILALHSRRGRDGHRYHWKELLDCVENPLLTSLVTADGTPLRVSLYRYADVLRKGLRFIDPIADVLTTKYFVGQEDDIATMLDVLGVIIGDFKGVKTPSALGTALQAVCTLVREHITPAIRERSQMDMETLYQLENVVIPLLKQNLMKDEPLPLETLSSVLDGIMNSQHMFFEPGQESIASLQIMGVLESTLLNFDRVYILEATDDRIPGNKKHDPLLPDSLRAVIGLPDLNLGDQEIGYAIHRLCACSGAIRFYWQEGVVRTYIFDGKKTRSRFVEEFIWQKEMKEKKLLIPGNYPLDVAPCTLQPKQPGVRLFFLEKGNTAWERMKEILASPISPTTLDHYLLCPVKFAFERLGGLGKMAEVNEGDDPAGVGILIHKVLQKFYAEHMGEPLNDRTAATMELQRLFCKELYDKDCQLKESLPPESLAVLEAAANVKLESYVRNQADNAVPILLEHSIQAQVPVGGMNYYLEGRFDRLDKRGESLILLDYKSGRHLPSIRKNLWMNEDFFRRTEDILKETQLDAASLLELDSLLDILCQYAASIQLPCYITIAQNHPVLMDPETHHPLSERWPTGVLSDASFVHLASDGKEVSFCPSGREKKGATTTTHALALSRCNLLVRLVLMHMSTTQRLVQHREESRCASCNFVGLCMS